MKILASFALASILCPVSALAEQRCGWLNNPSTANWALNDADGSWIIMESATRSEAKGMSEIPDLTLGEYVYTNAVHGYGCACMSVDTDDAQYVLRIHSVRQLPLSKCRKDSSIQWFLRRDE